jgi:transposase
MTTTPPSSSLVPKRRRTYTPEFKRSAVALAEDIGPSAAAKELLVDHSMISAWRKALRTEGTDALRGQGHPSAVQTELMQLRRENATLRMEREILKKATEFFMREPK